MGQYADSVIRFLQYSFKVLPELHRQADSTANWKNLCISQAQNLAVKDTEAAKQEQHNTSILCNCLFALYPGTDMESTLSFILSLHSVSEALGTYRSNTCISDEREINKLYSCLSGAVDPSRNKGCALASLSNDVTSQKKEAFSTPCLSDQCRLHLAILPSYSLVAPKLKKYMQFYIDLQSYRHYPQRTRTEYLQAWSDYYLKRYHGISCWEFCAASDSLLGIIAMYTAATNPKLTAEDIKLLDEACFPWLCGLDSLLYSYIRARVTNYTENLNFTSFYENLKKCEERLLFFMAKAEEACTKLKESSFYMSMIKAMTGIYLTEPEANFGMYKLVSLNILKTVSSQTIFYSNACRLMRLCRIF